MDTKERKLLTGLIPEEELAAELALTTRTLCNWRIRGEAPPWCRVGRRVHYFTDKLPAWLEARMQGRIREHKGR